MRNAFRSGAVAAVCAVLATESLAQTPQAAPESPIEDVLITAQKRTRMEAAQSVPVAVTAFDSVKLDEIHAHSLQDLSFAAPNVTLTDAGTIPGYANFAIRGLGINSTIPSVEPAVGVFIDGIYQGMAAGAVLDLYDIADVEILRGPQTTLFGHNTTGGAILVNTQRPGDVFAVHGRAGIESGPEETIGVSVEGPLGNGFKGKIAAYYDNDAGWFENQRDGRSLGVKRAGLFRPTLVWSPNADFDSTLIYEHGWRNGGGAIAQNPTFYHGFDVDLDNPGFAKIGWDSVTLESNWRVGPGAITNLFGYRRLDQDAGDDIDGRPVPRFHAFALLHQHQISEELRYSGTFFDRLDLTAGLYYFTQDFLYLERRILNGGLIDSTLGGAIGDTNYSVFAEGEYHLNPEFSLVAGGRFVVETKDAEIATFVPSTAGSRCDYARQTCQFDFPGPRYPGASGSDRWDNFTPKLGFNWRPEDTMLVYGSWKRGVRSGGYNVRSTSFTIPPGPYEPELQDAFEIGAKSDWLDRRLRVNGAVFYDIIDNLQRDVVLPDPVVVLAQVTRNTADATIYGAELELTAAVGDDLVLFANAGYTEGRYDDVFFDLDGGGIGPSDFGLAIPRLNRWSYDIGALYSRDLGGGFAGQFRVDYGYRSRAASTDSNDAFLARVENLSAGISLFLPDGHWSFSVYGRNLLDNVTEGGISALPPAIGGGFYRTLNEGRVIGAETSFRF
jgi:iron complex outermembrane receptor protein